MRAINAMYEAAECTHCAHLNVFNQSDDELKAFEREAGRIAKLIYDNKKLPKGMLIDEKLTRMVAEKLMEATVQGFGLDFDNVTYGTKDAEVLANLERNVYQFSSAKNYHQLRQMTDALKNSEGKIVPFAEFKAKALQINKVYNSSWLKTEYNTAISSAEGAANWKQYEEGAKTMPFLQYQTAGDERVRDDHAALDGVQRKIDDDFWNSYFPPNGFNCRCTTMQLVGEQKATDMRKVAIPEVPAMFRANLAKRELVFPAKHPYYKMPKSDLKRVTEKASDIAPQRTGQAD